YTRMKPLYKITVILLAVMIQCAVVFAGGKNTNSPTNPGKYATIEATFAPNNKSVQVKAVASNNKTDIEQVILNFEDGSQEKFADIDKKTATVSPSVKFSYLRIIGVYVVSMNNNPLTQYDSSGYGHYIMNPDAFALDNPFHDYQTDLGAENADVASKSNVSASKAGPKC